MNYKETELLNVFLEGAKRRKVGRLAFHERRILFEFDPDFVASGLELSPFRLPLRSGVNTADAPAFDGLFGLFNDSLPDGWGRLLLDRAVEKHGIARGQLTPLDRLAHVGIHGMGALSYEPDQSVQERATISLQLDRVATESAEVLAGEEGAVIEKLLKLNGASSGARPKVLAQVSADKKTIIHGPHAPPAGYAHWMIKFASAGDASDIGRVEYAYSRMARDAGISMPETHLFRGKTKRGAYFGIKRFDREGDKRIHMHSLSGLLHADHRSATLDYDALLRATLVLTKDVREVERAFALACFNVLAHNRDDHAKNFSFLMSDKGEWRLAPAYDLTHSFGPGGEQSMVVMGEGKSPGARELTALAKKHDIKTADAIIGRVIEATRRWPTYADEAEVTKKSSKLVEKDLAVFWPAPLPVVKANSAPAKKAAKKAAKKPAKKRPSKAPAKRPKTRARSRQR